MFIQRLITSLLLAHLIILVLFFGNPWFLLTLILLITLVAGSECWLLIPATTIAEKIIFILLLVACVWLCGLLFPYWQTIGLITWILICVAILTFPNSQAYWGNPIIVAFVLLLLLPLFVQSLIRIYLLPQGPGLVLYTLLIIWAADIGAYLLGKIIGKHKMIPQVSPGKSWEGVLGGIALSMVIATAAFYYYAPYSAPIWFTLAFLTVSISIFGDLFISILKRRCHLKDTGHLIPGHGGLLDRLDSLIAATPLFYFGLTFIPLGI